MTSFCQTSFSGIFTSRRRPVIEYTDLVVWSLTTILPHF